MLLAKQQNTLLSLCLSGGEGEGRVGEVGVGRSLLAGLLLCFKVWGLGWMGGTCQVAALGILSLGTMGSFVM